MWIYKNTEDNKARFVLGEHGEKILICIGINPSTAEPNNLDKTLTSVKKISANQGFDGWIMLNLYPQRATNPNDLDTSINKEYHRLNFHHIDLVLKANDCVVWAAWGALIGKRPYLKTCLKDIADISRKYSIEWKTIGKKSIDGHPHHPLYLSHDLNLDSFDIEYYLTNTGFS
jgi:hypothetical protein